MTTVLTGGSMAAVWGRVIARGRALALPLVFTSASVGASMFVGDAICQWMNFTSSRTKLLEEHARQIAQAAAANLPPPPHPDIDRLLRAAPRGSDARVPQLPAFALDACPPWLDSTRSLSMFFTGFVATGPWQFGLQRGAEALFPGVARGSIGRKLLLNMTTAPINISLVFYLVNYLQGHSHDHAVDRVRADVGNTWVTGFAFWPAVHLLNLRFVRVEMRPFVASVAAAGWNVYISSQANKSKPTTEVALVESQPSPPPPTLDTPLPVAKA